MRKVLVTGTGYGIHCAKGRTLLEQEGFQVLEPCTQVPRLSRGEQLAVMADIDAVVVGLDEWDEQVYQASPKLKILARMGLGVDNIDLAAARRHGIHVTNVRASSGAVAELAIALMLCCLRAIPRLDAGTRQGKWERFLGDELFGKTVGLIGFGKIAQTLARRLAGFQCPVFAYDVAPDKKAAEALGVTLLSSWQEVAASCDIISLHLPATPVTAHLVDDAFLAQCRPGSYLINTGRGALVDEAALYRALTNGNLRAAASDVFEQEPATPDNPLFGLDNFFCTPHQGGDTRQTMEAVGLATAQAIVDTFRGKLPQNLLNG